jgi:heptosyltransferase-2
MNRVRTLKGVDKLLGTPLCFALGVLDRLKLGRDRTAFRWQRLLVTKLVAVGDLVVCLPTLKALRKSFPKAHIAVLVTPRVSEIVEGCPYVDEIIYYDVFGQDRGPSGLVRVIRQLRRRKFDLVLELDHYYRITTLMSYLAGIPNRAGFDLPGQGRRNLYTIRIPYSVDKHEVEVFLEAASMIGADASEKELVEIWVPAEDREHVDRFLKGAGVTRQNMLVGIHPGTGPSALSRRWSPNKFAELADWLVTERGARVIITGSRAEVDLAEAIAVRMTTEPIVAAGKTNLKQFAEIARRCRLVISVDTGPLHVATAMGTKVIGLYGPNTPTKWGPYGDGHITIYKALECSPCTRQYLGQVSRCRNPICMSAITVEDVKVAVLRLLRV